MNTKFVVSLLASALLSVGCANAPPTDGPSDSDGGMGGTGGHVGGEAGGMGGDGGQGGSGGAQPCVQDSDCVGTAAQPCADAVCELGVCRDILWPFGSTCRASTDPTLICDGRGTCGPIMPYGSDHCYEPKPLSWSECPTCDDADPTTSDACDMVGGLEQCVHEPLPEGHMCGPWYTIQDGKCCPHPDTVTP